MTRRRLALITLFVGFSVPASAAPSDAPAVLAANKFDGFALVADKNNILWQTPRVGCPQASATNVIVLCHPRDPAFRRWPWASVSKQMLAVLIMQEVANGRLVLDQPASRYLPALGPAASAPTIRQLLQHRAGLRNPEDTAKDADGNAAWYRASDNPLTWCLGKRSKPGGDWRYNNCDSIVLGALLRRVTGKSVPTIFAERIAMPLGLEATHYETGTDAKPSQADLAVNLSLDERRILARFGPAGGLVGTPVDLLRIDRALLSGALLPVAARATMWKGDPALGFMALAQWSFSSALKGCATPVRIVERRGEIGRFQVRNILLPDQGLSVIMFTANGNYDFGEIWQGKGTSHDLLAAAACSKVAG